MPLALKTVTIEDKVYALVQDGKPVFTGDDGKDTPIDVPGLSAHVTRLNGESAQHRREKNEAEAALKAFEGLNADDARKALETVANLDAKKLMDAGKVEEIKQAAIKAVEDKYAPVVNENTSLKTTLFGERLGNRFGQSKFIADKMAVHSDVVRSIFGHYYSNDDTGRLVAKYADGGIVYSKENPGSPASFEESLSLLVEAYPHKDALLKGTGGGSGSGDNRPGGGGDKEVKRSDWDKMSQSERDKVIKDGKKVVD